MSRPEGKNPYDSRKEGHRGRTDIKEGRNASKEGKKEGTVLGCNLEKDLEDSINITPAPMVPGGRKEGRKKGR